MPERLECEVLQKARYINTLTGYLYLYMLNLVAVVCYRHHQTHLYHPDIMSLLRRQNFVIGFIQQTCFGVGLV